MNAYQVPADPTAVIGRRIVAFIINFVILSGATFLGSVLADFKSEEVPEALQDSDICDQLTDSDVVSLCFEVGDTIYYSESDSAALTFWLPAFGVVVLNHIVLAGATGASVGKHIVGLRTVKKDTGQIAKFGPATLRTLLWIVDYIPYCFPLVGLITGLTTKGHRRVGDMAAGTLVVDRKAVGTPPFVPGLTSPAAAGMPGGYGAPEGAWSAPQSQPAGWGAAPPPPPSGETWAPPAPPAPSGETWAPSAPAAPEGAWGAPTPPAPDAPAAPEGAWSAPTAPEPEGAWSAPAPVEPAPAEPAPEPTTSFDAPTAQEPAWEPPAWEPPAAEQQTPAPEPVAPAPEPVAPAPEAVTPPTPEPDPVAHVEPEPVAQPEPQPEPVTPAEPVAPAEPAEPSGATSATAAAASEPAAQAQEQQAQAASQPGVGAPMWDPARNAYIQWDPSVGSWMQWDDAAQQWRPIS